MTHQATGTTQPPESIPSDDPRRQAVIVRADDDRLPHLSVVGDTYTVLLTGEDTAQRYTLIDMHVPTAGGPPPHRHDFEEMFTVLEGEVVVGFRGESHVLRAGQTVNVPANAPHSFRNVSSAPARLLCMCTPPGQERFFMAVGARVATRTSPPPPGDESAQRQQIEQAEALAAQYRTELLIP